MLTHKGTKNLQTKRLLLRRFKKTDDTDMFKNWTNDDAVTKFLSWPSHENIGVTRLVLADWVCHYEKDDFYQWAMVDKKSNEGIGSICVVALEEAHDRCEIGYCMSKEFWGQGLMAEAFKEIIVYLFDEVGFERISATHHIENIVSGRVMEKAGLIYEGTLRHFHKSLQGEYYDCKSYAILKSDKRL